MANIKLSGANTKAPAKVTFIGDAASNDLFGANFLFNRDGGKEEGTISNTFQDFANEVSISNLRYPGGTVSEVYFDLTNPNSIQKFQPSGSKTVESTVPLSTFLEYAESIGASVTIVIPTYNFLCAEPDSTGNRQVDPSKDGEIREFIAFCLAEAERTGTKISAFEIGNEWYVDNSEIFGFRMSPIEYGRVAAYLTKVIDESIDKYLDENPETPLQEPSIAIQVGPGGDAEWYTPSGKQVTEDYEGKAITATELIFRQFTDPQAQAAVDAIISHRYLHGTDEEITGWSYSPFETWAKLAAKDADFQKNPDRLVTEWNVSARNDTELGLKHFDTLVELVEEMMIAGVDQANIWAVQQRNSTRFINNSGLGSEKYGGLSFAGVAFDMMSSQLSGLRVIKGPESSAGIALNGFGSDQKCVYFLTNRSENERSDTLQASELRALGHHATIYQVTEGPDGKPVVSVTTINLSTCPPVIKLDFSANESMMIVVARGKSGSTIEGYGLADSLLGSNYSDVILGGGESDTIDGSNGNDSLYGQMGNDSLLGGMGNDLLDGGTGNDFLDGGIGDDTLVGGAGHDTLIGGSGIDVVSYKDVAEDLTIDMQDMSLSSLLVNQGVMLSIEGFIAGSGNDTLLGDDAYNRLVLGAGADFSLGRGGNDSISGDGGDDTIYGGAGDDLLDGGDDFDLLYGGVGTDSLFGGGGDDNLYGDEGSDFIWGGGGVDLIYGGSGNDAIYGEIGGDFIWAEEGDDAIWGGDGDDQISGGLGNDTIRGELGDDLVSGGEGNDSIQCGAGNDTASGDGGNDVLLGGGGSDELYGGLGNDKLIGEAGDDLLSGGEGADTLSGGYGADSLFGGEGNDSLSGGELNDVIFGGGGNDTLQGDTGNDTLTGDAGDDRLVGGAGRDQLYGGSGKDFLFGGAGEDSLFGDDGNDILDGGTGNDLLYGGVGDDSLVGSSGNDTIFCGDGNDIARGGSGNDLIVAGGDNDKLYGESGDDVLVAGSGRSTLVGGSGKDTFVFSSEFVSATVTDFSNNIDTLSFSGALCDGYTDTAEFVNHYGKVVGGSVIFDFGEYGLLTVNGINSLAALYDDITFW